MGKKDCESSFPDQGMKDVGSVCFWPRLPTMLRQLKIKECRDLKGGGGLVPWYNECPITVARTNCVCTVRTEEYGSCVCCGLAVVVQLNILTRGE